MDVMDLDIDMDVELVPDEPIPAQARDTPSPGEVVDPVSEIPLNRERVIPNKIHIRGLDDMNPRDVKAYLAEHHPGGSVERIEWIDDSAANLVFSSDAAAQEAITALATFEIADVSLLPALELVPAKPFSQRAAISLQVRVAVEADKKQPRAAEKSRFYLLNPEFDPENRKKYRDRRDGGGERRSSRRYGRDDEPREQFDVNLYDDDAAALATRNGDSSLRRRRSYTPNSEDAGDRSRTYRNSNRRKELFPDSPTRNRSASPARDRDGDAGMRQTPPNEGSAETNRRGARVIKERLTQGNRTKELFPDATRSQEAERLDDADELSNRFSLPLYDGSQDRISQTQARKPEDRGGGGRLADRITNTAGSSGFSIRGTAGQAGADQGLSIKGGANKTAKELFPDKLGPNAGKELFTDRPSGRSRRRQKAGDLFD